ncbi:MAG: hypothetical protein H6701_14280 [Myxococcales bacterium]|nr:hypothetical protein [Myxococcales bacterium]
MAGRGRSTDRAGRQAADAGRRWHPQGRGRAAEGRGRGREGHRRGRARGWRRAAGEAEAEKQKKDGEKEAGGFFGWLASKAKAFFDRVKKGISAALAKARALVKAAIDKAKKLAAAAIEAARKAIVAAIELVGKALIAIGDRLLAGFPALRDKFRASIEKRVQQATDAVNAAAKKLNDGVQAALDGLGKGLDAALGLLERGLHFIVDGVNGLVQGAIKAAEGLVSGIAGFAALIKDIAAGPGQWIGNLGAAVKDGIQNHLWGAFKTAVRAWLESKLMEVLGIGGVVIRTLIEGGFDMPRIAETAWEGLKAAIPIALISLLIEKLVSMIVPAAGAVMAIIEGLQAAWGTVSRIVAAFAAFMAFLRLVKSGNAGPAFAQALAAGAVVVIDFVSNWLIKKIVKAAKAVGRKLKGIAQKLMKKLKRKGGKGKKNGPGKKNKDKNKDDAAARREAKKAARSGWSAAKAKASRQVMSKEAVEQSLRGAEGTHAGVKVKLDVQAQGKGWTVKATGSKKGRTATATHGRGSTLRTKQGGTFYAAADIRPVEKRVEAMTRSALAKSERASPGAADALPGRLEKARQKGQSMLDGRVKGLRLTLAVDKAKAGAGQKAVVVALVEPNYHEWKIDLAGEGLEAIRAALQKVARRKGRYNQQLARLQRIANQHGAQVDFAGAPEPNASPYDFVKVIKVTFTKNGEKLVAGLTRDATGAHEGTSSTPGRCAATGRPLAHDPTTGAPVSATRPHDAVSAAMWKKEIEALGLQAGKAPSDPIISALTAAAGNAGNWFMVGDGRVANQHKHPVLPANPNKPGKPQSLESLHGDKSAEKRRHVADNAAVDQATGEILIEYGNASPQHGSNLASVKPQHLKGDDWAKLSPKETRAAVQARIRIAINGLEAVAKAHPDHAAATWLTEAFFTRLENRVYNAAIKKS